MPYTQPNLAQAVIDLSSRLNDPTNVRWLVDECQRYIREAIRTWNTWTSYYRDQDSFTTVLGQAFYDLSVEIPTLRGHTVTNWDLITDLQYSLIEPAAPGGTWTGTDQFTLEQLSFAIQRRRDQFLLETGAVLTRSETLYAAPDGSGRLALDEAVANVRRAVWTPSATMIGLPLKRTDEWAATHYGGAWTVATTPPPSWYSVSATPPLTLQLIPPAIGAGTLDMVSLNIGTPVDPVVDASLGIPDDFAWIVKYGALADLLKGDALALDNGRAAYCEERWRQGLEMARAFAVVLAARIGDVDASPAVQTPMQISALSDADKYSILWQLVPGSPGQLLLAGQNLVACWPPPGGLTDFNISVDVVRNAPVPNDPADILQVGQEMYDSILDIAQHTALFKEGVGQVEQATSLLDGAARAAGVSLRLQQASQPSRAPLMGQTEQDRRSVAEQRTPIMQGVEAD